MKLLIPVTPFGEESALTALTSSRMDERGWGGFDVTNRNIVRKKKALPSPCSAKEVYFGQACRGVKDVTASGV